MLQPMLQRRCWQRSRGRGRLLCSAVAVTPPFPGGGGADPGGGGGDHEAAAAAATGAGAEQEDEQERPTAAPDGGARRSRSRRRRPLASRLARLAATLPQRVDLYFEGRPLRRVLWLGSTLCAGYYLANTLSLSFGALAVNDVVAAALSVAACEWVTRAFYGAAEHAWPPPFWLWLANAFKLGFTYALLCDSFKLGG